MNEASTGGAPAGPTPAGTPGAPPSDPALVGYPVHVDIHPPEQYKRFAPLYKWLLAIPHYIVLVVLGIGVLFAAIGAFFAILFTGRYPRGLFDFMLGVYRWGLRVGAYVYLLVDEYPPFSLEDDPNHPVRVSVDYPEEGVDRWRPLVHWLLVIPYAIVAAIILYAAYFLVVVAFFTILFTRGIPDSIFRFMHVAVRWNARSTAYTYWMTTRYPPFAWG